MILRRLSAHVLRITLEAMEPVRLGLYPGSAIRGALFEALLRRFCMLPTSPSCQSCPLHPSCPVAGLVAPLREEHPRGQDVPRPFVLSIHPSVDLKGLSQSQQPSPERLFQPGEQLAIDLTLLGKAGRFFPYVALSLPSLEELGLGSRLDRLGGRRGRVRVTQVEAVDPFAGRSESVYGGDQLEVTRPLIHIGEEAIANRAEQLPTDRLTLRFLTPTRLVGGGRLLYRPEFQPLILRLVERLEELELAYGEGEERDPQEARDIYYQCYTRFGRLASQVHMVAQQTTWVELASYSSRQQRTTPIGGFTGEAIYEGDLTELRKLLVWGEVFHVGKNAVKGDGCYWISRESSD